MQYTDTQISAIKLFGRKDLSFGCWLFIQNPDGYAQFIEESDVGNGFTIMSATDGYSILNDKKDNIKDYEILGHIPHLEDLFRVAEERGWLVEIKWGLLSIHFKDRTYTSCKYEGSVPLLEQPSLSEILNLFK